MLKKIFFTLIAAAFYQVTLAQNLATLNVDDDNLSVTSDIDSVQEIDPATGKMHYKKTRGRLPLISYRTGLKIYTGKEADEPIAKAAQTTIEQFFRELYADEIEKEKDYYDYIMILIDENGSIDMLNTNFYLPDVDDDEELEKMRKGMWTKLEHLTITPAKKDGKPVPYLVNLLGPANPFKRK